MFNTPTVRRSAKRLVTSLRPWLVGCLLASAALQLPAQPVSAQDDPDDSDTPISMTGRLHVIHADHFDHQRSKFFYKLEDLQTNQMYDLTFRRQPTEALHSGSIMTVHGTLRGSQIALAGTSTRNMTTVAPAVAPAVTGQQRTLVLMANFRDANVACSTTHVQDTMFTDPNNASIDDLYQENSFGQLGFSGDVSGPYTIAYSTTSPCDYVAWSNAAEAAALARGLNVSQYPRRVYVFPQRNSCGYIGLGTVGGNPSRSWIFECNLKDVFGHELGHNLGSHHASTPTNEYGDLSDIMGYSGVGLRHMNAPHKDQLGWLSANQIQTVTQNGVYTIAPLELGPTQITTPQVLKIAKPDSREFYYFSYRRPLGLDARLPSAYTDKVNVHRYAGSGPLRTFFLQALTDGGRFADTVNGLTVTQLRHDERSATVQVAFDCAAATPFVTMAPASQVSRPGTAVQYTVSVTNRDPASCGASTLYLAPSVPAGWSGTFRPASLSLRPGARGTAVFTVTSAQSVTSGSYSVEARVSDPRVATHTANATATVVLDTTPPTAPGKLTSDVVGTQIRLTWTASTDNTGISSYTVWRNGARRAVVTGTTYTDTATSARTQYSYVVTATDRAGNVSAPSAPASARR